MACLWKAPQPLPLPRLRQSNGRRVRQNTWTSAATEAQALTIEIFKSTRQSYGAGLVSTTRNIGE
jgi:hypothetical protein